MESVSAGRVATAMLATLLLVAATAAASVNKSVRVEAGARSEGASSINGNVSIGAGASVAGGVHTVNGTVDVENEAAIEEAETVNGNLLIGAGVRSHTLSSVNGSIRVAENVTVDGDVTAVNGRIGIGPGSRVTRNVRSVNGAIKLDGTDIAGNLETVNGDVTLANGAVLHGDLIVEKPSGWGTSRSHKPQVVIGPGSSVLGRLRLERPVDLFISESAGVGGVEGAMRLADAVRFSGDRP